jgi:hypothetical protein
LKQKSFIRQETKINEHTYKIFYFFIFFQDPQQGNPLHEAAANGNDKALEVLLTGGADRNSKDALVSTKQVTSLFIFFISFLFSFLNTEAFEAYLYNNCILCII